MNTLNPPSHTTETFPLHPLGYIRQWLVTGPRETPYKGPRGDENTMRREALDRNIVTPPASALLHGESPFSQPWRFYHPGENFFVEHTAFHSSLTLLDSYGYVEVDSTGKKDLEALFWVAGTADLWVNEKHIVRFEVPRYMYLDFKKVILPLQQGMNRICVRLQCFGVRDTRTLFGLQFTDTGGLVTRVPGSDGLREAAEWLDGVRAEGTNGAASGIPAPSEATVVIPNADPISWPAGASCVSTGAIAPFQFEVQIITNDQVLQRTLEVPANRFTGPAEIPVDMRKARLDFIAKPASAPLNKQFLQLLARKLNGTKSETDGPTLDAVLAFIGDRCDCADFALATLLRMESLGLADSGESAKIRRTALAFRYWSDEPGSDAMCFWSENHSLLFHGCQMIAGNLYPGEIFINSNRSGAEQAALGAARCREWLDRIEAHGLDEFNSGSYLPITVGALLNVVDFSADPEMSRRASRLLDRIYEDLAIHAFKGVVISPQGRIYRNVLYPEESGAQALLSDASSEAMPDFTHLSQPGSGTGDWLVFSLSSQNYRPPAHLGELLEKPVSKRYHQATAEIVLHKTADYLLTSLAIPESTPRNGEKKESVLLPGMAGYQQHLWQATLGKGCHIFVNHPGCSFDQSQSRPGYWYGNGVLPRLTQSNGVLRAIHNIPDGSQPPRQRTIDGWSWPPWGGSTDPFDLHPIPFTHAHWPSDAFDQQEVRDHWLFGRKESGCIGLWCSETLKPHDEMLTGREFRAWAYQSAWLAVCGSISDYGSFELFIDSCLRYDPRFDRSSLSLHTNHEEPFSWKNE